MPNLKSKTQQTFNDGEKGQTPSNVYVRIKGFTVQPSREVSYQGQKYTGATIIQPEFYYKVGAEERVITQGTPEAFYLPSAEVEAIKKTIIAGVSAVDWQEREQELLLLVLRKFMATELNVPLFGINVEASWETEGFIAKK